MVKRVILNLLLAASFKPAPAQRMLTVGPGQQYKTIQAAASTAVSGDIVNIKAGIYRETITPNSGITFNGEPGAIVSGLEKIDNSGWIVHSGNVYKKSISLPVNGHNTTITSNLTLLSNQLFKDGEMMFEASTRSLKTADDLFDISKMKYLPAADFQPTWLRDNALQGMGNLTGGTLITNGWFVVTSKTITSHKGNQLNYGAVWDNTEAGKKVRKSYFVIGKLSLLNEQKEWFYENGTLYFWQPNGGRPTGVEFKARNWGFDLRGKNNVKITGLTFKGCEPVTGDDSTSFITIDNIRATYTNHSVRHDVGLWQGYGMSKQMGVKLCGTNNTIKNSQISYSASNVVWLGSNGRVENNLIHHIGYDQSMGAPVALWGVRTNNQVITHNTFHTTGRTSIDFGYDWFEDKLAEIDDHGHQNVDISYNDLSNYCLLNVDGGATYAWGAQKLDGSRMHHNWVHQYGGPKPAYNQDGIVVGFYFDQATGVVTIDHNVFWDNGVADIYHETSGHYKPAGRILYIYNNTFVGHSTLPTYNSYRTYSNDPDDVMRNNIYRRNLVFNWGKNPGNSTHSLTEKIDPRFKGTGNGGLKYRLQNGSPAINTGIVIPGITNGSLGTPDMGAYEYGSLDWSPGYNAEEVPQ
jgi:hypothetical protein